jgi:hypothetical protein
MKDILLNSGGHPLSLNNLYWLNTIVKENVANMLKVLMPSDNSVAIIDGCVLTGDGVTISITDGSVGGLSNARAGTVIYNGKIYEVKSGTVSGSFTGPDYSGYVGLTIIDNPDADLTNYPNLIYADGSEKLFYVDKVMQLTVGGGDIPSLSNVSLVSNNDQVGTIKIVHIPSGTITDLFEDTAPYLGKGRWRGWRRYVEAEGRVIVSYNPTDSDFALGGSGGEKTHTLTDGETPIVDHTHNYGQSETGVTAGPTPDAGGPVQGDSAGNGRIRRNAVPSEGVNGTRTITAHNNLQPYIVEVLAIKI